MRDLFRYFRDGIRVEGVADRLRLSEEEAADVLKNLLEQGFVEQSGSPAFEEAGTN
jgi:predicted transcriptional regulator